MLHSPLRPALREPLHNPLEWKWGGSSFSPASLFANGEPGLVLDTMSAASLGVSAIGDAIASATDLSPNGKDAAQGTAANRPVWDGQGIRFDGSNDGLQTAAIDFSGCEVVTVMLGVLKNADVSNQIFVELTATAVSNNGGWIVLGQSARLGAGLRGSTYVQRTFGNHPYSRIGVLCVEFDISQSAATDEIKQTIDGMDPGDATTSSGTNAGSGSFANAVVNIGRRNQASLPLNGTIFRPVIIGRAMTDEEKASVAAWIGEATNQHAAFSDTPTEFSDSAQPVNKGAYYQTSAFAHADYQTEATVIDVDVVSTITSTSQAGVGVYVDGVFSKNLAVTKPGTTRHRVYLAPGSKVVSVVNGVQTRMPDDSVAGEFFTTVSADRPLTRLLPERADPILVYGDSISVGMNALPNIQNGWVMRLRAAAHGVRTVEEEGWNGRAIFDEASNSTKRSASVANLVQRNPATLLMVLGVNDYIRNLWTAANFGVGYAALLDDIHAALPDLEIYCQTQMVMTSEGANGMGSTLPDYRNEVIAAVAARDWITLVDGEALIEVADLDDNVHPDTDGHGKIAAHYISLLGLA